MIWEFCASGRHMSQREFERWVDMVSNSIDADDFPPEIADMVEQYDRNSSGYVNTTSKLKADIFLTWMRGFKVRGRSAVLFRVKE